MTWVLLTGAGLVVETTVIIVMGRAVTARYDGTLPATSAVPAREGARPGAEERVAELVQRSVGAELLAEGGRDPGVLSRGPREQLGTGWT